MISVDVDQFRLSVLYAVQSFQQIVYIHVHSNPFQEAQQLIFFVIAFKFT